MKRTAATICCVLLAVAAAAAETENPAMGYWAQWRGPLGTGMAPHGDPPVKWDSKTNIKWSLAIPGTGHSSPVIWGNYVFLTTAVAIEEKAGAKSGIDTTAAEPERRRGPPRVSAKRKHQFIVYAISRDAGKILWQREVRRELPHEGIHISGSWASNSAVTDGRFVYADFGSRGLYCFDFKGELKWKVDLGDMKTRMGFGEGSSPALHGDTLVVNWDHQGQSFVVALDKKTGKTIWKKDRDEVTSWATPVVAEFNGKTQVIISATKRVRSYDLANGDLLWQCGGLTMNVIPTPIVDKDTVYVASGFRGNAMLAIRAATAKGDVTGTDTVAWRFDKHTPYTPSMLLADNTLYFLKRNDATLTCLNARSGKLLYGPQRLAGLRGAFASPVGAGDRIYICGRNGVTQVIRRGPKFKVLATNTLAGEQISASPAIVGNAIFVRTHTRLYCIARAETE